MNQHAIEILEYNKIKEALREFALSEPAKAIIDKLEPSVDINNVRKYMEETTEARRVVNISSSVPIHGLNGIKNVQSKLEKAGILTPEELELVSDFIHNGKRLKRFMKDKEVAAPKISSYALSISVIEDLTEEIDRCIVRGRVDDKASSALSKVRKRIYILEARLKGKLDSYLKNGEFRGYVQDSIVSQRDGRYVLPVKSEHKNNVDGNIIGVSDSGSTVFIEPVEIKKLQDELNTLRFEEEREVYKILSSLTAFAAEYEREISINIETMIYYDFLFAKGKYSKSLDGREVLLNTNNYIKIMNGKHPLLGNSAVPLDFEIGRGYSSLVITGPNTGGKTVVLKTVGLLTMMVQSGLHVPVGDGSEFSIYADVLADIGDGQSIEQSLSTFSSHMKNIIGILHLADQSTLVVLDEIGSGTDPGEGMGIGIAVLEKLHEKGATVIATTHYNEIKDFAESHQGFINGCMGFDIKTLKPLYRLRIGESGESNAFLIALRLGMDKDIIERAHLVTYKSEKEYSSYQFEEKPLLNKEVIENHLDQIEKKKIAEERNVSIKKQEVNPKFNIGDCVYVSNMNRTGIVCEAQNSRGEVGVMVMKKKFKINQKRLSLYIGSDELYPENYDFDIVFESKDSRKKKKLMDKGNTGIEIEVR
jgi:DNA mismatch repair protein MutS2